MSKTMTLTDDRSVFMIPLPYELPDPDAFANRSEEIDLIQQKIQMAQAGPILLPLVEIHGVIGLGKSWLLAEIAHQFRLGNKLLAHLERPSITALVDLAKTPSLGNYFSLLTDIVDQIMAQLSRVAVNVSISDSLSGRIPLVPEKKNEVARDFVQFISRLSNRFVLVLLFDTTERAEEELLEWLEDKIVHPIVRSDQVILTFAGRRPLRWRNFEVRRRIDRHELFPFRQNETIEQLLKLRVPADRAPALASVFQGYAFGHPLANKAIFKVAISLAPAPKVLDEKIITVHEDAVRDGVQHQVIKRFLDEIRSDWRDRLVPLIDAISVLRKFNPTPLKYFAARFIGPDYEKKPVGFYLDAIRDMQATTLVEWSSSHGGYIIKPVVRKIMAKNSAMRDRDEFRRRNLEAQELYNRWLRQYPRNAVSLLIERCFHQTWVLRTDSKSPIEMRDILVKDFQAGLREVMDNPEIAPDLPDMAIALKEELERDTELKELVSGETYVGILQVADKFVQEVRGT